MDKQNVRVACLAPSLTDEKLAEWVEKINAVENGTELRDALDTLLKCVLEWWNIRESTEKTIVASTGVANVSGPDVRLQHFDDELKDLLFETTPWMKELNVLGELFESLDPITQTDLRNMAFHMLWFAKEICNDREPLTLDRIVV